MALTRLLHKTVHDLDIIKINECLVAKNILTNVTKMNEHSNVATFVRALVYTTQPLLYDQCQNTHNSGQ